MLIHESGFTLDGQCFMKLLQNMSRFSLPIPTISVAIDCRIRVAENLFLSQSLKSIKTDIEDSLLGMVEGFMYFFRALIGNFSCLQS